MRFKRTVRKYATSKVVTVPKDLQIGKEYEFEIIKGVKDENS